MTGAESKRTEALPRRGSGPQERPAGLDVLVVGAGTAGLTTALALARLTRLRIAVIDQPAPAPFQTAEVLSDDARPSLESLQLWRPFLAEHHLRALARRTGRGSGNLRPYDLAPQTFIYDPHASGWTVERSWFNTMLAREASRLCVLVRPEVTFVDAAVAGPPRLSVAFPEGSTAEWTPRFVVDASGAPARYARRRGADHLVQEKLTAVTVRFVCHAPPSPPKVEPWAHGWWYSDQRPNGQLLVSCMTDPEAVAPLGLTALERWWALLDQTRGTRQRVEDAWAESTPVAHSACSRRLRPLVGGDWLAVDEAACSIHPLAEEGVLGALKNGLRAASAIHRHFEGRAALAPYAHRVASEYNRCLRAVASYYATEQIRWAGGEFWKQRRALV